MENNYEVNQQIEIEEQKTKICSVCGTNLQDGQQFCPSCGTKVGATSDETGKKAKGHAKKKKGGKSFAIIAVAAVIILIICAIAIANKTPNFNDMYGSISMMDWCEISDDGKWMRLDTNPDNIDDDDSKFYRAYLSEGIPCNEQIEKTNLDLGFSSALYEKMRQTTALQGVQEESNDKYRVSWTYHPDKGLEVMYEIIK